VIVSRDVTFTVAVSGTPPFSYQWLFNGLNINGATNSSLVLTSVQASQAGAYSVTVGNAAGQGTSAEATLTVLTPPVITAPPVNRTVVAGNDATFSVSATGTASFSYQWRFDGADLPGATNLSYTVVNAQSTNAGLYAVAISNVAGSALSTDASLT